jgi:serine-type D-Ala-D-Ala carboxypeptidase (penicillin-binding protein 5/6)
MMQRVRIKAMQDKNFSYITLGAVGFLGLTLFAFRPIASRPVVEAPVEHVFPRVTLQAKAAYVYDLREGKELFAKNADTRLPLASVTKLMSALVASDLLPSYGTIKVSQAALATYGDSGLTEGEKWTLKNLLDFSLLTSSNDGIHAVALSLAALNKTNATDTEIIQSFVSAMNAKASALGLKNTYFLNETGLDESEVKNGAYGSARDISTLVSYILIHRPELLEATREPAAVFVSLDNFSHAGKNTNTLVRDLPGILGSKTGFTDIAGGNVVFAFDPELGRPIVISVLGSSASGRFEDAKKLVEATMEYIGANE